MISTVALIDGDILAYRYSAAAQQYISFGEEEFVAQEPLEDVIAAMNESIASLCLDVEADRAVIFLTCDKWNWRKDVLPTYKANRAGMVKPVHLKAARQHLIDDLNAEVWLHMEADDVIGIKMTRPPVPGVRRVAVSIDKDFGQIPGTWYNPNNENLSHTTEEQADYLHMKQTLTGDPVDGYKGCPGVGQVKAEKALDCPPHMWWMAVVGAYEAKGLTEADALVQARVARICRYQDFDMTTRKPILWKPL